MNSRLRSRLLSARGNPHHSGALLKILEKLNDEEQRILDVILENIVEEARLLERSRASRR